MENLADLLRAGHADGSHTLRDEELQQCVSIVLSLDTMLFTLLPPLSLPSLTCTTSPPSLPSLQAADLRAKYAEKAELLVTSSSNELQSLRHDTEEAKRKVSGADVGVAW